MYQIAIKMLVGDRIKYLILVGSLAFSTLLMVQQASVFLGVMQWIVSILENTNSPVWVVDQHVSEATTVYLMRDTDLYRVKSVPGVQEATPLSVNILSLRLYTGEFLLIRLVGVDSTTLYGVPPEFIEGKLEDLWQDKAILIDEVGLNKINRDLEKPLGIGSVFDINDHEVKIAGIIKARNSFDLYPYIYTTYDRAATIAPPTRKTLSYILVEPEKNITPEELAKRIQQQTGLQAVTNDHFFWQTINWYIANSGIPTSFGITIALGFVVGFAVAGQTFYSFIKENMSNFGALKAMGASQKLLCRMVIIQSFLVGFEGYGIGLGLGALFGFFSRELPFLPFYLSWEVMIGILVLILMTCSFAAFLGIRKINQLQAYEVFHG